MTHTTEDLDGERTEGTRPGDGPVTDLLVVSVLALEAVNFVLLAYMIRWTVKAGSSIIAKISQAVGLRVGKGSILGQISKALRPTGALPSTVDTGEVISDVGGDIIDLGGQKIDLSKIDGGKLEGLARQYLGGGGASPTGQALAQKFLSGSMGKGDVAMAIPFFLDLLKAPQTRNNGGPTGEFSRW